MTLFDVQPRNNHANLANRVAFERVFNYNKELVMYFLNLCLGFSGKNIIKDVEFLEPVQGLKYKRYSVIDVLCKDMNGIQRIVQIAPRSNDIIIDVRGYFNFKEVVPFIYYYAVNAYIKRKDSLEEVIFLYMDDFRKFPRKWENESKIRNVKHDEIDSIIGKSKYKNPVVHKNNLKKFSFTLIGINDFLYYYTARCIDDFENWLDIFSFLKNYDWYNSSKKTPEYYMAIRQSYLFNKISDALNLSKWADEDIKKYEMEEDKYYANTLTAQLHYRSELGVELFNQELIEKFREIIKN